MLQALYGMLEIPTGIARRWERRLYSTRLLTHSTTARPKMHEWRDRLVIAKRVDLTWLRPRPRPRSRVRDLAGSDVAWLIVVKHFPDNASSALRRTCNKSVVGPASLMMIRCCLRICRALRLPRHGGSLGDWGCSDDALRWCCSFTAWRGMGWLRWPAITFHGVLLS